MSGCPRLAMETHQDVAVAALEGLRAWRLGQVGALMGGYPEPTDALLDLVLTVDNEVGLYRAELQDRERRKVEAEARAARR